MRVVIAVPWRSDEGGRRDQLWAVCRKWLEQHHPDVPIIEGQSPDGHFNRAAAINDAVAKAGDFDVVVVHDADVIANPPMLRRAVQQAHDKGLVTFPFKTLVYCDELSTENYLDHGDMFLAPELTQHGYQETVKHHHYSCVQAIPRSAWQAVGGFVSMPGWGAEDAIAETLFNVFVGQCKWLDGSGYHLWHRAVWYDTPQETAANRAVYANVLRRQGQPKKLWKYLQSIGHPIS